MLTLVVRLGFGAVLLLGYCATTPAQSNLTAKANVSEVTRVEPESDRSRDGLVGPVRRVRTAVAKLINQNGRLQEGKHAVLEIVAYDLKGHKIENQYFPVAGANLTGKEVYKYDDKGNISEMTLVNDGGSLLSKEIYKYEFDFAGNWNKMTTSVAVIESGQLTFEPAEITHRSIMYYLDEKMLKMAQPKTAQASPSPAAIIPAAANSASSNLPTALQPAGSPNSTTIRNPSPSLPAVQNNSAKLNNIGSTEIPTGSSSGSLQTASVRIDSEPPPVRSPILKPVSGGVLNGVALSLPAPAYPNAARHLRVSGVVAVEVVVDESGKVIGARATSGPAAFKDVAVQAALRARFSPTKLSGQPVKVTGTINYRFALPQ